MTDRIDIIQKIANLRQVEGRTEEEALACLNRAERLMHSYRIEEAEIALAEANGDISFEIVERRTDESLTVGRNRHKVQMCLYGIEKFTETRCVIHGNGRVSFTGDKPDVDMALYLTGMIRRALDSSYESWKATQQAVGRSAKPAFQMSMASRLGERMTQIAAERTREPNLQIEGPKTGTALMIVEIAEQKRKEVHDYFTAAHPKLGSATGFSLRTYNGNASSAGREAASKINFQRPVTRDVTLALA